MNVSIYVSTVNYTYCVFYILQCVKMFTTMIKNIQKDESLRYILTWLSDLLMDEDTLVKVAEFTPL